jgi:hypothetical protein
VIRAGAAFWARVSLTQDNNSSEEAAEHSQANWEKMLAGLKQVVEGS